MAADMDGGFKIDLGAAKSAPDPAQPDPAPAVQNSDSADADDVVVDSLQLGEDMADAMQAGGYHPVVLFGTQSSGKTHLLLSLFALIKTDAELESGIELCRPILPDSDIGGRLHKLAYQTFSVKTQEFIEGKRAQATMTKLPFFIPVEFTPKYGPPVRLAFMESKGEWYQPKRDRDTKDLDQDGFQKDMQSQIETFISEFQGSITFVYLAPYTQKDPNRRNREDEEKHALHDASLAISGVIGEYDRIRINRRGDDRHMILLTKWDEYSTRHNHRASGLKRDFDAIDGFLNKHYSQVIVNIQNLQLDRGQWCVDAYSAGLMTERGVQTPTLDDDARAVLRTFPMDMWAWIYGNALEAAGGDRIVPFPQAPAPSSFMARLRRILDAFTR